MDIRRTGELLHGGLTKRELARSLQSGERVRVRHGAWSRDAPADAVERHRQLIAGSWPLLGDGAVLSHASAGILHGLPAWEPLLARVATTRAQGGHGGRTTHLHVRLAALAPSEVVQLDGYRVTTLERTAFDLARSLSHEQAVAVLDAALHQGAVARVLVDLVDDAPGRRGVGVARRALAFADGRAESVGESLSRVRLAQAGLPAPVLQLEIFDHNGVLIARVDFAWPESGVVGEFDGAVKYTGTPEQVARAVLAEKRRQQAIEDAGWRVVRWTWSDLSDRERLRVRIGSALVDSARLRRPA